MCYDPGVNKPTVKVNSLNQLPTKILASAGPLDISMILDQLLEYHHLAQNVILISPPIVYKFIL